MQASPQLEVNSNEQKNVDCLRFKSEHYIYDMQKLEFKKPGIFSNTFNLLIDDKEAGLVKFPGFIKNTLVLQSGNKSWELRHKGFFNHKFYLRAGHDPILNYFLEISWKGTGTISLGKYQFTLDYDGLFKKQYYWKNQNGDRVVEMLKPGILSRDVVFKIKSGHLHENEIMTLTGVIFFLILMQRRAAAAAS